MVLPKSLLVMIGQQTARSLVSYKTLFGNDVDGTDYGISYILFMVLWLPLPSEKGYSTINDSPEAITFSWEVTTTPVSVTGFKPNLLPITIDSTKVEPCINWLL